YRVCQDLWPDRGRTSCKNGARLPWTRVRSRCARGRRPADADQAGDLRDLESGVAVEQEMAEQTAGIIIVATALPEGKRVLQQAALLGRESVSGNLRLGKPLCKSAVRGNHEKSSAASCQGRL